MSTSEHLSADVSTGDAWGPPEVGAVLGSLPDPVIVLDATGTVTWANHRAQREVGRSLADLRGSSLVDHVHPDDLTMVAASIETVQEKEVGTALEVRLRAPDGDWVHFEARGWSGLHDHRVRGIVVALRRLDDRAIWTVASGDARRRAAVLDGSPGLTLLLDGCGRLEGASLAFTNALGADLATALGRHLLDLVVPEDRVQARAALDGLLVEGGTRSFETQLRAHPGGPTVSFWLTASNLLDDEAVRGVVINGVAIAALVEARRALAHRATHDPLTGLANRGHILEQLEGALRASVGTTARVGVIFCDIDEFKVVNDAHGHAVGDAVLQEVGHRVRRTVEVGDAVGRMGGDELIIVCVRDSVDDVEAVMTAVVAAVESPIATEAGPVRVSLSAGCAVAFHGAEADELLRRADANMYRRKHAGQP